MRFAFLLSLGFALLGVAHAGTGEEGAAASSSPVGVDQAAIDERLALITALLAQGDSGSAAMQADTLPALNPDDSALVARRLEVLGLAPSRRAEAILGLQAAVAAAPGDLESWRLLATYLSWTPAGLPASLSAWQELVEQAPQDPVGRLGLARTLAWSGRSAEAIDLLDPLLVADPEHTEALLLRAQLARWSGDRRLARALLDRATLTDPGNPRVQAERARLYDDGGQRNRALVEARAALSRSPGLYEGEEAVAAVEDATRPSAGLRLTQSQESTGYERLGVTAPLALYATPDTRLRLEPGWERFTESGAALDRLSLGVDLRQGGLPQGLYLAPSWRLHVPQSDSGLATQEVGVEVGAQRPYDRRVDLRGGARRRGLGDLPVGGGDDLAPLAGVGSGGGTLLTVDDGLSTRELWAAAAVNPLAGGYAYATYTGGFVEDGNRAQSLAAGLGLDVLAFNRQPQRQSVTTKVDLYRLHVAVPVERYFSPDALLVLTPGAEWRLRPRDGSVLGVEGGVPLRAGADPGYVVGAFLGLGLGDRWSVEGRVRAFDDTTWSQVAGTLGVRYCHVPL